MTFQLGRSERLVEEPGGVTRPRGYGARKTFSTSSP
jgi:hypothetical protein